MSVISPPLSRQASSSAIASSARLPSSSSRILGPLLVVAQHEFCGAAPFPFPVLETVGREGGVAHFLAEFLRGTAAGLQADAFGAVERDGPFPGTVTDADVRILQVSGSEHVPQGVEPLEGIPCLEAFNGGEDRLFPRRQGLGPDFRPPGLFLVGFLAHLDLVAARHLLRVRERTGHEGGAPHVAIDLDGDDGHLVAKMGRDIEEQLFIVEEPAPVLLAGVFFVHGQVPHPVDVGGGGQPAMDRLEGIVFRIDLHPALDRRGGDQLLRVEGDGIALPAVRGQGVDQGVVVEKSTGQQMAGRYPE